MKKANPSCPEKPYSLIFFGTPDFAVPSLQALLMHPSVSVKAVITQPDRPAGRGNQLQPSPVKRVAIEKNIPLLQPERIKRELPSFLEALKSIGPIDFGVVVAFGQILPREVLSFPARGCTNVHASLLPRWRGAAPLQRAIMAGDRQSGVALMQMDEGLDTGAVYISASCPLGDSVTFGELHDKLSHLGADLLSRNLLAILQGSLTPTPQSDEGITYAQKITSEECCIDWRKSSAEIDRLTRALDPSPGAFTSLLGKRLKVFRISPSPLAECFSSSKHAGAVCIRDSQLLVKSGDGAVSLVEVQYEGRKRMLMQDFLRGFTLPSDITLGNRDHD